MYTVDRELTHGATTMSEYIVVENAGYDREHDVRRFMVYRSAVNWMHQTYSFNEIDQLHVAICRETANGERSYEI
jgi:hypothetical protein